MIIKIKIASKTDPLSQVKFSEPKIEVKTMALNEKLNDSLIKERGGRHGGKGHEFQRYWALCHILKIDLEQDDYLVLLEFIEDVAVLNEEKSPTLIDLFQLKKKEGVGAKWTKTNLSNPQKDGKSILAKLCESRSILKSETKSISFVSNAPVELKLDTGGDSTAHAEFCASVLDKSLKTSLLESIAKEISCHESEIDLESIKFMRSSLAMDDLERHAMGCVAAYLSDKFPDHMARADVLCRALYSEIKVKATATEEADAFQSLKNIRGIAKSQFHGMLAITLNKKTDHDIINSVLTNLAAEQVPYVRREAIKKAARRYLIDKASKNKDIFDRLVIEIDSKFRILPGTLITSWEVANWILDQINSSDQFAELMMLERDYLLAVVLHRINE